MKELAEIIVRAPAKINLALDIVGLREDGYHLVEMIMQSIGLYDRVYIKKRSEGIKLTTSHPYLPDDARNLAYQGAELIIRETGLKGGVEIHIEKNIPLAAGLAGGSTDAAAVLKGINSLYHLNLPKGELNRLAAKLGADLPFCLKGGTAFAYGIGTEVEQLPDLAETPLILVTPPLEISTAAVYQEYDRLQPEIRIPVSSLRQILQEGKEISWQEGWGNVLEGVTAHYYPEVQEIKSLLIKMGVTFAAMSGSGPSVFAIVEDKNKAQKIAQSWPRSQDFIAVTTTVKQDFF